MVARRPIVLDGGNLRELPVGDTLIGAAPSYAQPHHSMMDNTYAYYSWGSSGGGWFARRRKFSDDSVTDHEDATGANPQPQTLADFQGVAW